MSSRAKTASGVAAGAILLAVAAATVAVPVSARGLHADGARAHRGPVQCHFLGPAWYRYGHTGHHYYAYTYGVSCSAVTRWAKKFIGKTVRPSQLRKNIPYPKYVLSGGPKGFTCYVETKPSGLDEHKHVTDGSCEKGPLPPYGEGDADVLFHWGATGGS